MVSTRLRPDPASPACGGRLPLSPRRRPARALALLLGAVLATVLLAGLAPTPAGAQTDRTLYFLTVKRGVADASHSGDRLFSALEALHGPVQEDREVDTTALELDIYGVSRDLTGLGIGVEVLRYVDDWHFADGERVHMEAKGVLFTLKAFLRVGPLYPFFGAGLGNYYVNYDELIGGVSLRDSPSSVYNARVGFRLLLGRVGLLLEAGSTHAQLDIPTSAGPQLLELGGTYANAGLSWVF